MKKNYFQSFVLKLFVIIAAFLLSFDLSAQQLDKSVLDNIQYRSIGPSRQGGRYISFAVVERNPSTFYAALASGGLWKTVNNGITFESVFDNVGPISIGEVEVDQNNPDIVWVGTGEANNSRTAYYGDGVYKSIDGGKSFKNMGLAESHHIGRILIHPDNSDIVWVAAEGHLYSENKERGVYKTTDGGKSWEKILEVKDHGKYIGAIDMTMDPEDPNVIYAAMYDKVRKPWTFNAGGPGSGIYKTVDGGDKWNKLTEGLPTGMLGRIGIDVSESNPNIIYANIENNNIEGVSEKDRYKQLLDGVPPKGREIGSEVYRSDDKGATWRKVGPEGKAIGGGPGYYYNHILVDPVDPEHVYVMATGMHETINGGADWERPFNFGGDNHAMWIDKNNPDHMMLGYDHGMGITYDRGKNWYHPETKDVGQFVAVGFDMEYPYNVYGGLQDNGSARGPSTTKDGSPIVIGDWERVGGGDGMYNVVAQGDPRYLYNESQFGPLSRRDQVTGETKGIRYRSMDRWAWNAPIIASVHDPAVVYHAGNKVVKSTNRGDAWTEISGDLTTNDEAKIQGTGNIQFCTIVTMEESTVQPGLLWVGTDDGKVWLTKDDGKEWTDVTANIPGHPGYWVSRVETSSTYAGRAYVTITGFRNDDFKPYVWLTDDFGETWSNISAGLPENPLCVVREHPDNSNLLFVGSTKMVHVSADGGKTWNDLRNNMPFVAIEDLKIHPRENDLIVATHGRSLWIADISYLSEISQDVLSSNFALFQPENKVKWVSNKSYSSSSNNFSGESESIGAPVYYYVDGTVNGGVVEILDGERVIYTVDCETEKGVHSFVWKFNKMLREKNDAEKKQTQSSIERMKSFGMSDAQIAQRVGNPDYVFGEVGPGTYKVKLTVGDKTIVKTFVVMKDHWMN
jgi:photosystem II stability/assembly factor-like uncharacterized protein